VNIFVIDAIRYFVAAVASFFCPVDLVVAEGAPVKNAAVFGEDQAPDRHILFDEPRIDPLAALRQE